MGTIESRTCGGLPVSSCEGKDVPFCVIRVRAPNPLVLGKVHVVVVTVLNARRCPIVSRGDSTTVSDKHRTDVQMFARTAIGPQSSHVHEELIERGPAIVLTPVLIALRGA